MTLVPHAQVNPGRARGDLVVLSVPEGGAHRRFLCADGYCIEPKCDCEVLHLRLPEVTHLYGQGALPDPGRLLGVLDGGWDPIRPALRVDTEGSSKSTVVILEEPGGAPWTGPDLRAPLGQALTSERLEMFMEHRREVRAWGRDNWWRFQDWSGVDLTRCVPWRDVFPGTAHLDFRHEGKMYLLDDQYCAQPDCDCMEAILTVCPFKERARVIRGLGAAAVSLAAPGAGSVKVQNGDRALIAAVAGAFLESRPGALDLLVSRKRRLMEFGRYVRDRWGGNPRPAWGGRSTATWPAPALPRPSGAESLQQILGRIQAEGLAEPPPRRGGGRAAMLRPAPLRNDPCPCKSGRKYKNCCGRD